MLNDVIVERLHLLETANIEEDNAAWRFSSLGLRGQMPLSLIVEDNVSWDAALCLPQRGNQGRQRSFCAGLWRPELRHRKVRLRWQSIPIPGAGNQVGTQVRSSPGDDRRL